MDSQSVVETTGDKSSSIEETAGSSMTVPTVYKFQVEKLRLIAYCFFWAMCGFAFLVTTFAVAPNLGPCPLTEGAEPTFGMHCSVLMSHFGFNNVSEKC